MSQVSQFFGNKPYAGMTRKAWVKFTGAGVVGASFNITSLTRTGFGVYDIVFSSAFLATRYMVPRSQIAVNESGTFDGVECSLSLRTTTTCTARMQTSAGTAVDYDDVYLEFWE